MQPVYRRADVVRQAGIERYEEELYKGRRVED